MVPKIKQGVAALFLFSSSAFAHYPVLECSADGALITCNAGFSDGSKAVGKSVKLYDYDENLLVHKKADKFSRAVFERPEGEFYIQFDSGHEFPVEVDYGEL
jgi:hypothetical protein